MKKFIGVNRSFSIYLISGQIMELVNSSNVYQVDSDSGEPLEFLLIEPVPGSCVVFPSFIPHFVIPCHGPPNRVSIACNFKVKR